MKIIIHVDPETGEADGFMWDRPGKPPPVIKPKINLKKSKKKKRRKTLKEKIKCPNCGKAYLEEKEILSGVGASEKGELPDMETMSIYECPKCNVQFHEEQLRK